jgi:hypothetical protein
VSILRLHFRIINHKLFDFCPEVALATGIRRRSGTQKGKKAQFRAADGIAVRTACPQVPPKVEYRLTSWGQSLCPMLDA